MKTTIDFRALAGLARLQKQWPADRFNAPSPQRLALDIMRSQGDVTAHIKDLVIDAEAQNTIKQFASDNGWQYRSFDQTLIQYPPPSTK